MSRRICRAMDDHEWVFAEGELESGLPEGTYCQACGVRLEDAEETHVMQEMDELYDAEDGVLGPNGWQGLIDYPGDGDD